MKKYRAAALCACGATGAIASPLLASGDYTFIAKGNACFASGTEEAPLVKNRPMFTMIGAHTGVGFSKFIIKARLVPTSAGFNFVRPSKQASVKAHPYLYVAKQPPYNRERVNRIGVTTNEVSADGEFKLQVKLVWDTVGPLNHTKNLTLKFKRCAPRTDGKTLLPAPARVAIGGG